MTDLAKSAVGPKRKMCDHICLLDDQHVERGELHFYGYQLPSPRLDANVIVEVLCSQALADHLGDVRDAETKLWKLLGIPEVPYESPSVYSDSAWVHTKARLKAAGVPLPSYLGDYEDDE